MPGAAASWSFRREDLERIEGLLHGFLRESNAKCVLLVDRAGQLITTVGERPDFDSTSFSSLAAADFSANDQLASMIGESEFSSLFHQGEEESMYLADIIKRIILVALFDNRTTLGMVRLKVKGTVRELGSLFRDIFARAPGTVGAEGGIESGFSEDAEREIDRLFGEL